MARAGEGSVGGCSVKRVLMFVAAFVGTAFVCLLGLKYLILDANTPIVTGATTQPERRRVRPTEKPKPPPEFGWVHALEPGLDHGVWLSPIKPAAMILTEFGPRAQLYFESAGQGREFIGSFQSGVREDDDNAAAAPIPNVIAVARKAVRP